MRLVLLVVCAVMLAGCGSGGGSGTGTGTGAGENIVNAPLIDSTPDISLLTVNPVTVAKNQGGGTAAITVGFNFFDRGADIYGGSVLLKTFDFATGNLLRTDTIPSDQISYQGAASGIYGFIINLNTSTPANYTFTVNLIDAGGRSSNALSGFFAITQPATPPPQTTNGSSTNTVSNTGGDTTSTAIITSYMSNKHQVESTSYATDLTSLKHQLAAEGHPGGSIELNKTLALKLSHIQNFITVSLQYVSSTKSTYILDKPAIKSLFMSYQTTDKADMSSTLSSVRTASFANNAISDGDILIDSYYSEALYQIDAM